MILALLALSSAPEPSTAETVTTARKPIACQFFTPELAAKLLGQKPRGVDDEIATDDGGREWRCTFSSASDESEPKIHFLLIKSPSEDAAKRAFEEIRSSNRDHKGFEEWPGVSDEAIVHSDGQGFHFVMIRKGVKTIRIKVNPIKDVPLDHVKRVAAALAMKLE